MLRQHSRRHLLVIMRLDGSEDGNLIGKYLDTLAQCGVVPRANCIRGVMNRTDSIGLAIFTTIAVAMDGWLLASRCEFSPTVHPTATAVALILQLMTVG